MIEPQKPNRLQQHAVNVMTTHWGRIPSHTNDEGNAASNSTEKENSGLDLVSFSA